MVYILVYALALASLAAVCWVAGVWLVRGLGLEDELGPLVSLARVCCGLAVWSVLLFVLAALGLLTPVTLRLLAGLALGLAVVVSVFGVLRGQ